MVFIDGWRSAVSAAARKELEDAVDMAVVLRRGTSRSLPVGEPSEGRKASSLVVDRAGFLQQDVRVPVRYVREAPHSASTDRGRPCARQAAAAVASSP